MMMMMMIYKISMGDWLDSPLGSANSACSMFTAALFFPATSAAVYDVVNRLPVWRPNNSINLYAYVHAWVILFLYISITRQHSTVTRDIDIANLSVRLCHGLCVRDVSGLYNIDKKGLTYCNSFFHRTVAQSF